MKLKVGSLTALMIGVVSLLVGFGLPYIRMQGITPSNGIIGGADYPTYRYLVMRVMKGFPICCILLGTALVVTALFCLIFSKTVRTGCSIPTSAIALGLSAVGGMGCFCALMWYTIVAFQEVSRHPIAYPASVTGGLVCFIVFLLLLAVYALVRKRRPSIKGIVIDIFTAVVFLPFFFYAFSCFLDLIS